MPTTTLLPIGSAINHNGVTLKIIKRLSAGLAGDVYEGELFLSTGKSPEHVVIKGMKIQEYPYMLNFFSRETETLSLLMDFEEEANKKQNLYIKVAPIYYGSGEYKGTPYIVMESINGAQLPAMLRQMGSLSEKQALTVAWHLFRTLDILHTRLNKTFIDLKFENLWWAKNPSGIEQLKLTDFGTLENINVDKGFRGIQRDILLSSVYFFAMLTGYTLEYSLGELRENAKPVIEKYMASMSWGVRKLLLQLLHRNPANRITSAQLIALEMKQLVGFWDMEENGLSDFAERNLIAAQKISETSRSTSHLISDKEVNHLTLARSALDILYHRNPHQLNIGNKIDNVENLLSHTGYLQRGMALFLGRSYSLANQVFREGIESTDNASLLRRWAFFAEAGEDNPSTFNAYHEEVTKIINSLSTNHWEAAIERLNKMIKTMKSRGLDSLKDEAELFAHLGEAEVARGKGEFKEASLHYKQARQFLYELRPEDAKFIQEKEVGDLSIFIEEMDILANTRQKALQLYNESFHAIKLYDYEAVVQKAFEGYFTDRSEPSRFKNLNKVARELLNQAANEDGIISGAIQAAESVANINNWEMPVVNKSLSTTWQLARELNSAIRSSDSRDSNELQRALEQCFFFSENDSIILSLILKIVVQAGELARKNRDYGFLKELIEFCLKWNLSRGLQIFLCHASSDKNQVRDLSRQLKSYGFDAWLDEEKLLPGQNWQIEIPKAVHKSHVVIVCLTNNSINKEGYIQKEIKIALDLAEEKPDETIFIIPAKLEECKIPDRLSKWQCVNLFEEKGFEMLVRSLNMRIKSLKILPLPGWIQSVSEEKT